MLHDFFIYSPIVGNLHFSNVLLVNEYCSKQFVQNILPELPPGRLDVTKARVSGATG